MRKGVNNEETKLPPSRTWKKKYDCKVNKGAHTLVLVKPDIAPKDISVEEYYKKLDERMEKIKENSDFGSIFCKKLRNYKCTACGYKVYTFE